MKLKEKISWLMGSREKPAKKVKAPKVARKRGRPAQGEVREPLPEKRIEKQVAQSAEDAIKELPTACDRGTKMNAKGYKESWNGYKLTWFTEELLNLFDNMEGRSNPWGIAPSERTKWCSL